MYIIVKEIFHIMGSDEINIIYVDDDADDRFLFEEAINLTGQKVNLTMFSDGLQLVKILKENNFGYHLIFLDLNLPIKNGIDLLKEIRDADTNREVKIIILSTSENPVDIETAHALNAVLYVKKPYTFTEMVYTLKDILKKINTLLLPTPLKSFIYHISNA